MNVDVFDRQIDQAHQRLKTLSERVGMAPAEQSVLAEALEQLSIALHELQVTSEELHQQVEELASARQALEVERQPYQDLYEFATSGYVVTDEQGIVVEAKRAASELFGVRQEFLIGKPLIVFVPVAYRDAFRHLVDRAQRTHFVGRVELQLEPRDGPVFPVACVLGHVTDQAGRVIGLRWSFHDITELKEAGDRALQSARLAAIGEAMVGLTHESRNALQCAQASLELLTRRIQDRPDAINFLERVQDAQDHLHQLFEEVRDYAAPIRVDAETCDLGEILQATWSHLMLVQPSRVATLNQDSGGLDLCCEVDGHRMKQVFRNILGNSLAACSDPVEIRARWSEGQIARQKALQVALADNGPGLSREGRERLFDPFYTTKTQGTGLGMAITKRIVEAHGGRISIGDMQAGTEIVVMLPRLSG
jgi:PAS domain S-box-containing protein